MNTFTGITKKCKNEYSFVLSKQTTVLLTLSIYLVETSLLLGIFDHAFQKKKITYIRLPDQSTILITV